MDCHHVRYGTNSDSYVFTIRLDSCGSQWVDALASGGKAYLENVIIIQNEPGIQEVQHTFPLNTSTFKQNKTKRGKAKTLIPNYPSDLGYVPLYPMLLGRITGEDSLVRLQHRHAGHADCQLQRRFGYG